MKVAVPDIVIMRKDAYTFTVAVIPPLISNTDGEIGKFLRKLNETLSIERSCKDISEEYCYTMLFGGVNIFRNGVILKRFELNGYIEVLKEKIGEEFDIVSFYSTVNKKEEWCYSFNNGSLCYHLKKCDNCRWIDNIGLRTLI